MRFHATIELGGKTATGIEVPEHVVTGLGKSRRPAVHVTIRDYTYRSTVTPMGGRFMIPVSAAVREKAGVAAGDEVDVDLELDTEPRTVTVPADLDAALTPAARRFLDGLSYSQQRAYVDWIESAKRAETRVQRVTKAAEALGDGRKRY